MWFLWGKQKMNEKAKTNKKTLTLIISAAFLLIIIIVTVRLVSDSVNIVGEAAKDSFDNSLSESREAVYNDFYNYAYDKAAEEHHVENDFVINIEDVREVANLQVLEATDTEYSIHKYNKDAPMEKYEAWFQIDGKCIYKVDLKNSEFIVDQYRKSVTVRIPQPQKDFSIDTPELVMYADDSKEVFGKKLFDGSSETGKKAVQYAEAEGRQKIIEYFSNNDTLDNKAEKSAENILKALITEVNSNVEDLKIEIEILD